MHGVQGTIDEIGFPLAATTFVVVDLETTGGSPSQSEITEIGAVKVRGGDVLGEFSTLVRPTMPVPPFIAVLTGITDAMLADAPRISAALPSFLEFARGSVLVAHNAPFDIGFLRAACEQLGTPWPAVQILDTARLARRVLARDEAHDCKLATLARIFGARTTPTHRALDDARATVDVLHGLIERLGNSGVYTVEELSLWQSTVTPAQRSKRHLAEQVPAAPGVYVFSDDDGRALYVGKSTNMRSRVRNYFTASETRTRMTEMVAVAASVRGIECATTLEAEVRELRMIGELKPRYNRRSRFPERGTWLKLTVEPFPRLSLVRQVRDDGTAYLGPFGSRRSAEAAMAAVHEAVPIRQCTQRLSPKRPQAACILAEMGRCGAPCSGAESVEQYSAHVDAVRSAFHGDPGEIVDRVRQRIDALARRQRYEEAAEHRDRLSTFVRAAIRCQRIAALAAVRQLVAARRLDAGGWELHVIRHGRLAAAGVSAPGADPRPYVDALVATAETVATPTPPLAAGTTEEAEAILRWLDTPGVRLAAVDGCWSLPAPSAAAYADIVTASDTDSTAAQPFADRRGLRPTA
ncbi:DEDD exnuclease domain-containing protein [Actinobacteria bacterium YIM 96077]|uniref:DEDD exnuclease domain-containing protein n=1 Tax=Phytoactinopolyspora halophila TaxID=1981511 RepID=A0A329QFJ3_9ACTN|nr:DEDD exonuclease domain-containing protein [Phytoactinopolyspora halophila]AYY13669.1 DEDD exnuclease domain-containing protein [Actinobacteria bacterium YIM 96077]RAW11233.1 DEDD exnuclease domain-containing protein [Phytoactinopolyspora halophila]